MRKKLSKRRRKAILDRIGVANAKQLHNATTFVEDQKWPSGARKPAKKIVKKIG